MAPQASSDGNVFLYILAVFIPPVPVFLKRGLESDFWLNILLWFLGWLPGVIHAWYIISRHETVRKPVTTSYADGAQNSGSAQYPNMAQNPGVVGSAQYPAQNPGVVQNPGSAQYPDAAQYPRATY